MPGLPLSPAIGGVLEPGGLMSVLMAAGLLGGLLRWLHTLFSQHGYLIIAILIAGESAGLPLPGETSLLTGAVLAERGSLNLALVMAVAAAAAIIGDNLGYLAGRRAGRALLERYGRFVRIRTKELAVLDYYYDRHGAKTVFFGRWVALLRVAAALFAGASRMAWPRFLLFNALGGIAWVVSVGLVGYLFAASASGIKSGFGIFGIVALVVVTVAGILFMRRTERRLFGADAQGGADTSAPGTEPQHGQDDERDRNVVD
jgi:membrane protein DedA with SNARE-associated domain